MDKTIEFHGALSEECRKFELRRVSKIRFCVSMVIAVLFCIPYIILAFAWHWIYMIAPPVFLMMPFIASASPSKKTLGKVLTEKVVIRSDTLISEGESFSCKRAISQVKKVVDMGDWYRIVFYSAHRDHRFICQKNLLVKGTLQDFESLFAGKIKKKVSER